MNALLMEGEQVVQVRGSNRAREACVAYIEQIAKIKDQERAHVLLLVVEVVPLEQGEIKVWREIQVPLPVAGEIERRSEVDVSILQDEQHVGKEVEELLVGHVAPDLGLVEFVG